MNFFFPSFNIMREAAVGSVIFMRRCSVELQYNTILILKFLYLSLVSVHKRGHHQHAKRVLAFREIAIEPNKWRAIAWFSYSSYMRDYIVYYQLSMTICGRLHQETVSERFLSYVDACLRLTVFLRSYVIFYFSPQV